MFFFILLLRPEAIIAWFLVFCLIGSIVGIIVFLFRRQRFYRGFILGGLTGFVLAAVILCVWDFVYTYPYTHGYLVAPPPDPDFWQEVPEGENPPWLDAPEGKDRP